MAAKNTTDLWALTQNAQQLTTLFNTYASIIAQAYQLLLTSPPQLIATHTAHRRRATPHNFHTYTPPRTFNFNTPPPINPVLLRAPVTRAQPASTSHTNNSITLQAHQTPSTPAAPMQPNKHASASITCARDSVTVAKTVMSHHTMTSVSTPVTPTSTTSTSARTSSDIDMDEVDPSTLSAAQLNKYGAHHGELQHQNNSDSDDDYRGWSDNDLSEAEDLEGLSIVQEHVFPNVPKPKGRIHKHSFVVKTIANLSNMVDWFNFEDVHAIQQLSAGYYFRVIASRKTVEKLVAQKEVDAPVPDGPDGFKQKFYFKPSTPKLILQKPVSFSLVSTPTQAGSSSPK